MARLLRRQKFKSFSDAALATSGFLGLSDGQACVTVMLLAPVTLKFPFIMKGGCGL